ncbi:MAG: hypothetical protein PHE83_14915 [Opitutaceae bacterium]|nr:hypothetical protein [Opitutaceae bacterium]
MHVPFFKSANADGSIDVKARPVSSAPTATPTAIASRVAPDLGDYATERPEPLPASGRIVPLLFWVAILGALGAWAYSIQQQGIMRRASAQVQQQLRSAQARTSGLNGRMGALAGKLDDLHVLSRWADLVSPMREVVIAVLQSANERIQIHSLQLQRKEPTVLRYSLQVICVGSDQNFTAMKSDLLNRLTDAGWTVTDNPPESEDARLMIDFSIMRKLN